MRILFTKITLINKEKSTKKEIKKEEKNYLEY